MDGALLYVMLLVILVMASLLYDDVTEGLSLGLVMVLLWYGVPLLLHATGLPLVDDDINDLGFRPRVFPLQFLDLYSDGAPVHGTSELGFYPRVSVLQYSSFS